MFQDLLAYVIKQFVTLGGVFFLSLLISLNTYIELITVAVNSVTNFNWKRQF